MIGSKVAQMILDSKQLNFYKYDSDVKELLGNVRDNINQVCLMLRSAPLSRMCIAIGLAAPPNKLLHQAFALALLQCMGSLSSIMLV